jgi:hypothetical protein
MQGQDFRQAYEFPIVLRQRSLGLLPLQIGDNVSVNSISAETLHRAAQSIKATIPGRDNGYENILLALR